MARVSIAMMIGGWALCVISIALSFILFKSIGNTPVFELIFGGAAIALEVIKFSMAPLAAYAYSRGEKTKATLQSIGFFTLMTLSIVASIGGLNKNTSESESNYNLVIEKRDQLKSQITNTEKQIAQRNISIAAFQDLGYFSNKADPLIKDNEADNAKLNLLRDQLSSIKIPERSLMIEGVSLIAVALNLNPESAKAWIYIVVSILFDIFGAWSLIVSETMISLRKKEQLKTKAQAEIREDNERERARQHELEMAKIKAASINKTEKEPIKKPAPPMPAPVVQTTNNVSVITPNLDPKKLKTLESAITEGVVPENPSPRDVARYLGTTSTESQALSERLSKRG